MTRNAVCLCTDRNMIVPTLYVASEAARRARGAYDVHVFAEETELTDGHWSWMERHGIRAMRNLSFPRLHATGATAGRISPASLIRLLLPTLLSQGYDRVLYLDADTEICGDLSPLFALDLNGRVLAAVPAARTTARLTSNAARQRDVHFRALCMTAPYRYFNSGVMLIDVERWNEQRVGERALEFIERNPAICRLPDEDALNAVLDGRIADLSPIWNFRADLMQMARALDLMVPVILHHDGPSKPWKRFAPQRRLLEGNAAYRRYRRFVAGTPWRDWLDRQWTWRDLRDSVAHETRLYWDRLCGRRTPGVLTRGKQRRNWTHWRNYLMQARFADVEQGITHCADGRLMPNPAKAR